MKNSIGVLQTKISLPSVNLSKVFIVVNLWIFLFTNFFVLVPVSAYAATASKMSDVSYTQVFKSGEVYTTTVTVKGTGTVGISNVKSNLGRQVTAPKSIKLPSSFDMEIKCGDTVKLTVDGVEKEIKSPACTTEVSSCYNPIGWIDADTVATVPAKGDLNIPNTEKSDATKGADFTTYYYALDKKTILATDVPNVNTNKFGKLICAGSKQNYEVKNGNTTKFQKIDNKIISKTNGRFSFASSGNDYKVYFAANAGDGFYFESKEGTKLEVVKVSVGGKKLNSKTLPVIEGDYLIFYNVLPSIDLIYHIDETGVSKQFVLRNADALKNNLSSIEFELKIDGKISKVSDIKTSIDKAIKTKADTNSTNVTEIKKEKEVVDNLKATESKEKTKDLDTKSAELDKLVKKIESKSIATDTVNNEVERINEIPTSDEKIVLEMSDKNNNITIDSPVSYTQNGLNLKKESVKIAGNTIKILPDLSNITTYPYIIDPRFAGNFGSISDTFVDDGNWGNRGSSWALVVGGRFEGGQAAIYTGSGNTLVGDSASYIMINVSDTQIAAISEAYLQVQQYGAWNTGGFGAQIIKTGWFTESTLNYYNQPAEEGIYGSINFANVNYNGSGQTTTIQSSNIAQLVREQGGALKIKIKDATASSKSATFCSRENNPSGGPCNGGKAPILVVFLNATPSAPGNQGPNYVDQVFGCTGQTCRNGTDIQYVTSGMNDGYANCISNNIFQTTSESQGFQNWRNPNALGPNASYFWYTRDIHVADFGATCGSWFGYWERKLSGNYYHDHTLYNTDGVRSGNSGGTVYSVDTSAPVQIEANNTKIPAYKNNGNISMTLPRYIDDARSAVYFQNQEGGVIDANDVSNSSLDNQVVAYVYPNYVGGIAQQWVIESNGQIRTLADGRCLTYTGADSYMTTLRCQFNSSYTTDIRQGYEYLPETKQIRLINDRRFCFAKEGSSLMLRVCSTATNQRWDVNVVAEPLWAGNTDKVVAESGVNIVNKSVQYRLIATNAVDGSWYKTTEWNTNRNVSISGLLDGKTYLFWMQARDRVTGTANVSDYNLLGSTTMDFSAPVITNYTETTPVISPNNPTSSGVLDSVTFTYDYKDASPYIAYLDIFPSAGGALTRRLAYNSSVLPTNLPTLVAGNFRQYYQWDGKDQNGNFVADGTYVIRALAVDQTCYGIDWYSPLCNRFDSFDANALKIKVDNTGANISVTTPTYNIWTNNKNYVITGGLGVYNKTGKEDKDVSELYINNVKSPFGTTIASNYNYTTNLNVGANTFTFSTKDQAGNIISTVGDPAVSTVANWVVNYDNTIPKINSIIDNTPAGTIKSTKTLKVSFSDTLSNVNLSNIAMDLYSSNDAKTFTKTQNLVNGGKIVNTNNVSALSCTTTECNVTLINLPDAYYKIFVNIADNATNSSCTFMQIPYTCNELATFDKLIQVGIPAAGNIVGNDTDNTKSLLSVNMFPTYDGVNSADVLAQLQNGTRAIDQVQGLTVKVKVSQGTEAVDLYYSYDTNIAIKKIATLNNTIDSRPLYNGRNANVSKSQNSYLVDKASTALNKCDKVECEWTYTIVYDSSFAGGFPKLVVTSYKGINQDVATKTWEVNGQLKGDPRVLTFNKRNGTILENANVYPDRIGTGANTYYTNTLTNRIEFAADASKTYTVTIRNSGNTLYSQNYTFVNDVFGSQYVEVNLPNADGNYDIVYNGIVVGKFVLDRVVPTLTSVQTTNLTPNTKAVMPFIRRGDSVKFDYTTSEPVWDSNLVLDGTQKVFAEKVTANCTTIPAYTLQYAQGSTACNDAWRNSTTNTSTYQINNWQGGVQGVDGIVNPKIELVDYAGNKGSYLSTVQSTPVYSQTPRGVTTGANIDFRLFADSISPDKSDFDTTSWLDGKDGVVADGVNPEADRIVNGRWVIRGSTITFKVKGERNARAVFSMNGVEQVSNSLSTNCSTGTNTVVNGLVVKFAELCDVSFNYNWTGTGAQNDLGEALDYRNFQFYTIDLSGNTSAYSNSVMIYNDKTATPDHSLTIASGDSSKQMTDNATNSLVVKVSDRGEKLSDVGYVFTNPKSIQTSRTQKFGTVTDSNGTKTGDLTVTTCYSVGCTTGTAVDQYGAETQYKLGTQSDERAGCTSLIPTYYGIYQRIGICEDGNYTIQTRLYDTAGNFTGWMTKTITRDTVAPFSPQMALSENNGINMEVGGEAGSSYYINGVYAGVLNEFGYASFNVMSSYMYSSTYTFNVTIADKVGNMSGVTTKSITTQAAPTRQYACTISSQGLSYPGTFMYPKVSGFDTTRDPIVTPNGTTQKGHDGLDLSFPANTEVLASMDGLLTNTTDQYGGKGVIIVSGNMKTIYWHLNSFAIANNTQVNRGQVIGYSGKTGLATDYHLHFGVYVNGTAVDPEPMLNCGPSRTLPNNKGGTVTLSAITASIDNYCMDDEGEYDPQCYSDYPIAMFLNSKTGIEYQKWSDGDKDIYSKLSEGMQLWVIDQKTNYYNEDTKAKYLDAVQKCIPDIVDNVIYRASVEYFVNYAMRNASEDKWEYSSSVSSDPLTGAVVTRYGGRKYNIIKINKVNDTDKPRVIEGAEQGLQTIYMSCGVDYFTLKKSISSIGGAFEQNFNSMNTRLENWVYDKIPSEVKVYTGNWIAQSTQMYGPEIIGSTTEIVESSPVRYSIQEVIDKKPQTDVWAGAMIGGASLGAALGCSTSFTGWGLLACSGFVTVATAYASQILISNITDKPFDMTSFETEVAMGLVLLPLDLITAGIPSSSLEKVFVVKLAEQEVEVIVRRAPSALLSSLVNNASERMVLRGASNELVGYLSENVVKDVTRTKVLSNILVKSTGELIDNNTGELLSVMTRKGVISQVISSGTKQSISDSLNEAAYNVIDQAGIKYGTGSTRDAMKHVLTLDFYSATIKKLSMKGGHYLPGLKKIPGLIVTESNPISIDQFGNYIADLTITYKGVTTTLEKSMWSQSFTAQQIADFMEEAYIYGKPTGLGNIWEYTFKNGMKVRWYKLTDGSMKSAFPIY